MVNTITSAPDTTTTSPPQSLDMETLQIANFIKEHEEVEMILPVLLGLFITSRLQLRGANALLVNVGIATVLRQMFKELKSSATTETVTTNAHTASFTASDPTNAFGEGVKIVHAIPGRIRLRIDHLASDPQFIKQLERLLLDDEYVIRVRINRAANSIAINYDGGTLSDLDLGLRLMDILNQARNGEAIA